LSAIVMLSFGLRVDSGIGKVVLALFWAIRPGPDTGRSVAAHAIPMVAQLIAGGRFNGNELQTQAAKVMLDELLRWAAALKTLRG
jgi:hypothetical protein